MGELNQNHVVPIMKRLARVRNYAVWNDQDVDHDPCTGR